MAGLFASAGSAQAATTWNATDTRADVVGAWAHGAFSYSDSADGQIAHATVTITDSKADGASARVYFRWRYAWGETSGTFTPLTASGY
ncbi:hypothetical protein GCM10010503_38890 [Streptomyces lucensis JCM 4490]|uniref:Uncharacterized protein n=1 Tax=Streptomyces lucensis JCM 4490 TaxID=1306176 RepID=A0A918MSY2_9ACTN|nr:hypothetical protein GCM10010503_38890 [Streptomyces lucensis JCM 4490]